MGSLAPAQNLFVNRDSGALCRVRKVDDSFAYVEVLALDDGFGLQSTFHMPVADYDETFITLWRPATAADLVDTSDEGFRVPKNAPDDWD